MKKVLALFVAVVAAVCVTASVALADPGTGVATAQFTAAYGSFTCKGQRIVTSGTNASVRDRETCDVSGQLLPEGRYDAGATTDIPNFKLGWWSDYEFFFASPGGVVRVAVSGTITVKNRPDGTSVWQIHVTY